MNKDYSVIIEGCTEELTVRERIRVKDTSNATQLDALTQTSGEKPIVINYAYHAVLSIHNEKSDNKDYRKVVVVDTEGNKYVTGSDSFLRALEDILDELSDAGEEPPFDLEVYRMESKNYKGKYFLTCSMA